MFSAASLIARRTGLQAQRRIMVSKPFQQLRLRKAFTSESGLPPGGGKGTENVPTSIFTFGNINISDINIGDIKLRNVNKYVVAAMAIIGVVAFAGTPNAITESTNPSTPPEVESCEDSIEEKGMTTQE